MKAERLQEEHLGAYAKVLEGELGGFPEELREYLLAKLPHIIAVTDGHAYVAFTNYAVVGDHWYVNDFGVVESHRGRGIGRFLLDELATLAWKAGISRLALHVNTRNERALQFYKLRAIKTNVNIRITARNSRATDKMYLCALFPRNDNKKVRVL